MKKIIFIYSLLLTFNSFGQNLSGKVTGLTVKNYEIVSKNDTIITVIYKNGIEDKKKTCVLHKW